jgi:transcriptional regulator with XRE-family HTH domain
MPLKDLYTIVGKRVRSYRDIKGLTQADISEKTKINRATISNIESGKQQVSLQYLYLIARELDTEISTFLPSLKELNISEEDNLTLINEHLNEQDVDDVTKNSILELLNRKPKNDK